MIDLIQINRFSRFLLVNRECGLYGKISDRDLAVLIER